MVSATCKQAVIYYILLDVTIHVYLVFALDKVLSFLDLSVIADFSPVTQLKPV